MVPIDSVVDVSAEVLPAVAVDHDPVVLIVFVVDISSLVLVASVVD